MADAKAIEDCKREISLLQVSFRMFVESNHFQLDFISAIESSECDQIYFSFCGRERSVYCFGN